MGTGTPGDHAAEDLTSDLEAEASNGEAGHGGASGRPSVSSRNSSRRNSASVDIHAQQPRRSLVGDGEEYASDSRLSDVGRLKRTPSEDKHGKQSDCVVC